MQKVTANSTMGAYRKSAELNTLFGPDYSTGPGGLPTGQLNSDMALIFGTFKGLVRPKRLHIFKGFNILFGKNVKKFLELSSVRYSSVSFNKVGFTYKRR